MKSSKQLLKERERERKKERKSRQNLLWWCFVFGKLILFFATIFKKQTKKIGKGFRISCIMYFDFVFEFLFVCLYFFFL